MRLLLGLGLSLALICQGAGAAPPAANHPIIGIWKLTLPDGRCSETYRFRGRRHQPGHQRARGVGERIRHPRRAQRQGLLQARRQIVKDNGKQDCSGEVMKVGTQATNFVLFHPSGEMFLMCASESMEACIGPFERVRGEEI